MSVYMDELSNEIELTREKLNDLIENLCLLDDAGKHELLELSRKMDKLLVKFINESKNP